MVMEEDTYTDRYPIVANTGQVQIEKESGLGPIQLIIFYICLIMIWSKIWVR